MPGRINRINERRIDQIIRVAKMYFEQGMSQGEIADREFISKSTVCRLIQEAKELSIVTFQVNYPVYAMTELEEEMKQCFSLDVVRIAPTYTDDLESRLADTCRLVADDLDGLLDSESVLTVGWGTTMESLAKQLSENIPEKKCAKVVLMNGSLAGNINSLKSSSIVETMARCFLAEGYLLPVPLIVDSEATLEHLAADSHVKYILDFARGAEISLFSVGAVSRDSVLTQRGAYTSEEYRTIVMNGAVGDVAGRFFDAGGKEVESGVASRMLGLTVEEIKKKPIRMGVAVGEVKSKAIIGALSGQIINRLYTDQKTALAVMHQFEMGISTRN